jgi:hypothetical protein
VLCDIKNNKDIMQNDIDRLVQEKAETIVSLTGFGTALHVNDIKPDLRAIALAAHDIGFKQGQSVGIQQAISVLRTSLGVRVPSQNLDAQKSQTDDDTTITLFCLNCEAPVVVAKDSGVGRGILNPFCNGECEDIYAARL